MASFSKTFDFNLRRDHQKNFLWASRLWVGRRKEPILGYVPKSDEKKNSGGKGLNIIMLWIFVCISISFMRMLIYPYKVTKYHYETTVSRNITLSCMTTLQLVLHNTSCGWILSYLEIWQRWWRLMTAQTASSFWEDWSDLIDRQLKVCLLTPDLRSFSYNPFANLPSIYY